MRWPSRQQRSNLGHLLARDNQRRRALVLICGAPDGFRSGRIVPVLIGPNPHFAISAKNGFSTDRSEEIESIQLAQPTAVRSALIVGPPLLVTKPVIPQIHCDVLWQRTALCDFRNNSSRLASNIDRACASTLHVLRQAQALTEHVIHPSVGYGYTAGCIRWSPQRCPRSEHTSVKAAGPDTSATVGMN